MLTVEAEEIKAAVEWWTNVLRSRPRHDAGDPAVNMMLAITSSFDDSPTEQQLEQFAELLAHALVEFCLDGWDDAEEGAWYHRVLGVDYHPDRILGAAAQRVGITGSRFPCKTHMQIQPGSVRVSAGYGSPYLSIYPSL